MTRYNIPNLTSGIDDGLIEIGQASQSFPIGILVFTYILVFLGGSSAQTRRIGYADIPFWNLLASISCTLLSLMMTIKSGFITGETLSIVISVTILSGMWFFMSRGRYEQ